MALDNRRYRSGWPTSRPTKQITSQPPAWAASLTPSHCSSDSSSSGPLVTMPMSGRAPARRRPRPAATCPYGVMIVTCDRPKSGCYAVPDGPASASCRVGRPGATAPAGPPEDDTGPMRRARKPATNWRGHGLVLVVEDEDPVRRYAAGLLTELGFTVVGAADGSQAVDVFRQRQAELALVLLDLTLPGAGGEAVLTEIEAENPKVPVGAVVELAGGADDRRWYGPVPQPGGEQQRTPVGTGVHLGRRVGDEGGERRLEQRAARGWDAPPVVQLVGLGLGQRVAEAPAELLPGQADRAVAVGRVAQSDRGHPQCRRRQHEDSLDRGRVDGDRGRGEPPGQQVLHDQPTEGVPDHDRLGRQGTDDLRVVVGDLPGAGRRDLLRMLAGLRDGVRDAGPSRRGRLVAGLPEQLHPGLPARRVQPQAVYEDHRCRHGTPPPPSLGALPGLRGRLVEPVDRLGHADRPVATVALQRGVDGDLYATGDRLRLDQHGGQPDPAIDRQRGGEPHLVQPVVDSHGHPVDREQLLEQRRDQRQGEVPVRDRGAVRAGLRAYRVDVDPLVVAGRVGEPVDLGLAHLDPVGDAQLLSHQGEQVGRCRDGGGGHGNSNQGSLRSGSLRKSVTRVAIPVGSSSRNRWPPPGTMCSRAVGISLARIRPLTSGTIGSSSPETTSVGWGSFRSQGMLVQPLMAYTW